MTKNILNTLLIVCSFFLYNCSSNSEGQSQTEGEDTSADEQAMEVSEVPAVCIWDKISVRETPSPKGKYITSLSVGESLTYLGKDSTVDKKTYANVLLNDEKEGWALKDFIVNNAKPAVVLSDISLYARPDLLTKSDKTFKMMDIISSIEMQGDWMKIKGRRSGAKWMDEGWVKSVNISFEVVDIAGAKFALEALAIEDETMQLTAINEVIENTDLSTSKFIPELRKLLDEMVSTQDQDEMDEDVMEAEMEDLTAEEQVTDSIG